MQIKINLKIFLFIFIFILTKQIEIYAWIMIFAFIHEMGHMISGILLKLKPKTLHFMPTGISVTFETYGYEKLIEIKKIIIALAGPITNLIICTVTNFLTIDISLKNTIIYSNILIAIFNLIPIYPLDGGRFLKSLIKLKTKSIEADKIVNKISNITIILLTAISSVAILYLRNIAILIIILYLWIIIIKENKKYNIKMKVYKIIQKNKKCIDI